MWLEGEAPSEEQGGGGGVCVKGQWAARRAWRLRRGLRPILGRRSRSLCWFGRLEAGLASFLLSFDVHPDSAAEGPSAPPAFTVTVTECRVSARLFLPIDLVCT